DDEPALRGLGNLVMAGQFFSDFSDTAGVVAALDLVVTVDTSVAHLAGALGRPVWILLPFVLDWRWLVDREDSPWYPTARLFRQSHPVDWGEVFERIAVELAQVLAGDRARLPPQGVSGVSRFDAAGAQFDCGVALQQQGDAAGAI